MPRLIYDPFRLPEIREAVNTLRWPFPLAFAITFQSPAVSPVWQRHFGHHLTRAFVCDDPKQIPVLGYQPAYWVAAGELGSTSIIRYHGRANVAMTHRRGTGFTDLTCSAAAAEIERAMHDAGYRKATVAMKAVTELIGSQRYRHDWNADRSNVVWGCDEMPVGQLLNRWAGRVRHPDMFAAIPSDAPRSNLDLLFVD